MGHLRRTIAIEGAMNTTQGASALRMFKYGLNSTRACMLVVVFVIGGIWALCLVGMSFMRAEL